jgi:hypothetical protein
VDPAAHVALSDHGGAGVGEHSVSGSVVRMIVRIDDELHRGGRPHANVGKEPCGSVSTREGVDDHHSVIADDEPRVGAGGCLGVAIVDGSPRR